VSPLKRTAWYRRTRSALPIAGLVALGACETQNVLDPNATQPGVIIASAALRDARDRLVPAIPDRTVAETLGATLGALELHLQSGDIVQARVTVWHVTRVLDAYRAHPNDGVGAELGAIRLAVWVVDDYLKIPFGG